MIAPQYFSEQLFLKPSLYVLQIHVPERGTASFVASRVKAEACIAIRLRIDPCGYLKIQEMAQRLHVLDVRSKHVIVPSVGIQAGPNSNQQEETVSEYMHMILLASTELNGFCSKARRQCFAGEEVAPSCVLLVLIFHLMQ